MFDRVEYPCYSPSVRPFHNRHTGEGRYPEGWGLAWMVSFTTPYFASSGRLHKVLSVAKTGFRPAVSVFSAFTPSRAGAVSQNVPVMAQNGTSMSPKGRVCQPTPSDMKRIKRTGGLSWFATSPADWLTLSFEPSVSVVSEGKYTYSRDRESHVRITRTAALA